MKTAAQKISAFLFIALIGLVISASPAQAYGRVSGYTNANGVFVSARIRNNQTLQTANYAYAPNYGRYSYVRPIFYRAILPASVYYTYPSSYMETTMPSIETTMSQWYAPIY